MPRNKKGFGRCHRSGTGNNKGLTRTTTRNIRVYNRNNCHSKSIETSLTAISVNLPLNNSVINPPQMSSVCQHSKSNELSSTVIPKLPPWNYPFIKPTQLSSVLQKSSSYSPNTTHDLQASSIPVRNSPYPSNTMPPPPTNDGNHNIYGCMVDVSKLTPAQLEQHAVMLLDHYHE